MQLFRASPHAHHRTPKPRTRKPKITPQAIALYRKLIDLQNDPAVDQWEKDGGKRRQYLDIGHELHVLLGRKPWETCIDDTIGADVQPDWLRADRISEWLEAQSIQLALDAAALR
jgi:beta-lactamase superfamily II metal-dependent hydrolase